jgi:hypothetical protein
MLPWMAAGFIDRQRTKKRACNISPQQIRNGDFFVGRLGSKRAIRYPPEGAAPQNYFIRPQI